MGVGYRSNLSYVGADMPTRLRVDLAGYHHVVNRGVNRCNIFEHPHDKEMF